MIYIHAVGLLNAIGDSAETVRSGLLTGASSGMRFEDEWLHDGTPVMVGRVDAELPEVPEALTRYDCRNNRLLLAALEQIRPRFDETLAQYGKDRVGIVMGTSTGGMAEAEAALAALARDGAFPERYRYSMQELGSSSEFLMQLLGTSGPCYTISTACSSSGRALISAQRLLKAGICDAVLAGGADTICGLTLNGFYSLEALSRARCNPFSRNRDGINIGEGTALMLLTREPSEVAIRGLGESSDAYHTSSPHPEGEGAEAAMRMALEDAGLRPDDIGYVNAHGTATPLNDSMEARAIDRVLGRETPCTSTKPLVGHTLGAAGITESAMCWLLLTQPEKLRVPAQVWDGEMDPELPPIRVAVEDTPVERTNFLSNSFAFGGNNFSVVLGRPDGY